jgi:hypothetical protein
MTKEYSIEGTTLRQHIEAIPESVIEAYQDDYADMRRIVNL